MIKSIVIVCCSMISFALAAHDRTFHSTSIDIKPRREAFMVAIDQICADGMPELRGLLARESIVAQLERKPLEGQRVVDIIAKYFKDLFSQLSPYDSDIICYCYFVTEQAKREMCDELLERKEVVNLQRLGTLKTRKQLAELWPPGRAIGL